MKKLSKQKLGKIYDLESILSYLNPDIVSKSVCHELSKLSNSDYDKIIDIAFKKDFENMDNVNKKSFSIIINSTLNELTDEEIDYAFQSTTYFPIKHSDNHQFVRNLLLALKNKYDWI